MGVFYGWILVTTVIFGCLPAYCNTDCENVVCQPHLECHYPRVTVVLPDPDNKDCCNITECICEGTNSRLSASYNPDEHYEALRTLYENCTMVDGNLELVYVHPKENFDTLDVTKHIRIVTGYVLISVNRIDYINLSSLRLIRGEHLYVDERTTVESCTKVIIDDSKGYALYISANYHGDRGLKEVHLPRLTEIMRGKVKITDNRDLCFVDTIIFDGEVVNSDTQTIEINNNNKSCPSCPSNCVHPDVDNKTHCWGNSDSLCQQFTRRPCSICPQRCNLAGVCCDSFCAAGCTEKKECHACKHYNDFGKCVAKCDTGSTSSGREVIGGVDNSLVKYELFWFCVKKCPATRRVFERDRKCVLTCPENYYSEDGYCKECPDGGCSHICYGLEAKLGPLKNDDIIHSQNIGNFTKNCTIIEGSLIFRQGTFLGDRHCKIKAINDSSNALSVFENVEEITGFLNIEYWPYKDLCLFKNLKRIRGIEKLKNAYSLLVRTDDRVLRQLCFNSLESIESGYVSILYNRRLCYVSTVQWDLLFLQSHQRGLTYQNKGKCSLPCNRNCDPDHGCWGPGSDQCVTCKNFTDYTNAAGLFVSKWVIDDETGKPVPGHNVTTCVETCDTNKGVYSTPDKKCYPCDPQCNNTCSGPGPTNCTAMSDIAPHGCKNVKHGISCKANCPASYYRDVNSVCQKCSAGCLDGGCDGPADGYQQDGCSVCHMKHDLESDLTIYRGHACQICVDKLKDSECALGCTRNNVTKVLECYQLPSNAYVTWIIVGCVILAVVVVITLVLLRCKKKIQRMRKHIGDKITGDVTQPDELETPLTPSGAAPNRAQLRIVKENELALGKELGSGAFGAVYKAVWTSMHIEGEPIKIPVAVKQLKAFSHNNEIMDEAYVMASVDSPYLIRLLGICMTEQVSLITQLMPLGSLLEYVRGHTDNIGSVHMLTWCKQIAKGMHYLEEKHLVHRDLAARNVLVKTPHHVKITDFGLSKMLNATQSVYFAEGGKLPIKWLAMECITERKFSHQSDVWAFGVTCWEIFTFGAKPYDGVRAIDVLHLLERGDRLMQPPVCTIEVYMLLIKCWLVDPLSRPKFVDLFEEFTNMCKDHSRYVVIENDPNPGVTSPNPEEEKRFFERLIREDNVDVDGELMLDDPDTYLLSRAGGPDEPVYQNQPAVERQLSNGIGTAPGGQSRHDNRLFSRNTPSAQLPTPPANVHSSYDPMASEVARINSRTSDSSNPDDVFAHSGNSLHHRLGKSMAVDLPSPGKGADQRAVRYRPNQAGAPWTAQGRKDSEENSRYTEDPTKNNRSSLSDPTAASTASEREIISTADHPDGMVYDEDEYLIPTPGIQSQPEGFEDYIDPPTPEVQGAVRPVTSSSSNEFQGSLSNNTYLESGELRPLKGTHPSSWPNRFAPPNQQGNDAEYVNSIQEHDYLNCDSVRGDAMMSDVLLQNDAADRPLLGDQHSPSAERGRQTEVTYFNNEEYMTADSGIGEDNHSVLSGNTGAQGDHQRQAARIRQNSSLSSGGSSSNGSLGPLITGSPVHRARLSSDEQQMEPDRGAVRYKPTPRPRTQSKRPQKNSSIGLDNPEYMMLQESVSDGKVLLDMDTRSTDA